MLGHRNRYRWEALQDPGKHSRSPQAGQTANRRSQYRWGGSPSSTVIVARTARPGSLPITFMYPSAQPAEDPTLARLHTLNACCTDPTARLAEALNRYAEGRNANLFARVFGGLPLYIPTQ